VPAVSICFAMAEGSSVDYWKMIIEHRDKLLAILKETDWVEAKNKDGIKVSYKQADNGKIFHVEAELDASPVVARRYVIPGPKGLREKFLKKSPVREFKVIEEAEKYFIGYEVLHGGMLGIISERDTISVYGGEDDSEIGAYMVHFSIEHPDYPPQSKPVRAFKHLAGQLFFPVEGDPNKCILHGVAQIDLGGMLPMSIVGSFQPKIMYENVTQLKQAIADKFHERN